MTLVEASEIRRHAAPVLVIVHPAAADEGGLDVFIRDRPPVRVASAAELNELLDSLDINATTLVSVLAGLTPCDMPACGHAATGAAILATPAAWACTRYCQAHARLAPEGASAIEVPLLLRSHYSRTSPFETADLIRSLISVEVPAEIIEQPRCTRCGKRLAPDPDLAFGLTWRDAEGQEACDPEPQHAVARCDAAALITQYVLDVRSRLQPAIRTETAAGRMAS
jgi:hypothetical protein